MLRSCVVRPRPTHPGAISAKPMVKLKFLAAMRRGRVTRKDHPRRALVHLALARRRFHEHAARRDMRRAGNTRCACASRREAVHADHARAVVVRVDEIARERNRHENRRRRWRWLHKVHVDANDWIQVLCRDSHSVDPYPSASPMSRSFESTFRKSSSKLITCAWSDRASSRLRAAACTSGTRI